MSSYKLLAKEMLPALEAEMRSVLQMKGSSPPVFYGMLHYHMGWLDADLQPINGKTGKRIRPLLCLLACAGAGGDWQQALPAGAAIEILHNFSLIHDDIEDASPTRHGRETLWKIWGTPQAINAGDTMFALAHLALCHLTERGVTPGITVDALCRFDQTCVALTQGQHADMAFETRDVVTVDQYLEMITGKTAVLLSLSAELGAKIANSGADRANYLATFGLKLGQAFQVIDDILGIWGDEARIGKSAATDIVTKKKTLPVLYGLSQSSALRQLYTKTQTPDESFVQQAVAELDACGAHDFARQKAADYSQEALSYLEASQPTGDAGRALFDLAHMLLQRDF